eukprot:6247-Heterococcus_DN1.PRE.2
MRLNAMHKPAMRVNCWANGKCDRDHSLERRPAHQRLCDCRTGTAASTVPVIALIRHRRHGSSA